ncbi:type II secretion system F family protein [Pseudoalteromonas sp. SG41-1]|uniref:type II secretion system F family protein n=1 Tax=Pseudoalteromonas sp. SG41-1 TaxID=2760979 RepID=UPI001600C197|nr:type II secretion system F family protein [Pseudoalteromonas sp. SG41-1]MBB1508031.1 type II secretion system F family protein [Pseudoalteromonas sp. SG41-1]
MISAVKEWFRKQQIKSFKSDNKARIKIYNVLIDSLGFGDSIKLAVQRHLETLQRRRQKSLFRMIDTKEIVFLKHANEVLNTGNDFSGATRDFVSYNEQMILDSGGGGKLEQSLKTCCKLVEDISRLKSTIISSMIYPCVLVAVAVGMVIMFSYKIIPILTEVSNVSNWSNSAQKFYAFSSFIQHNLIGVGIGLVVLIAVIIYALPNLTGNIRYKLDSLFPFSIYRKFQAGIFLISFSNLMESNYTSLQSLTKMKENTTKYIGYELNLMLDSVNKAIKPAAAINTHLLGEIGDEIEDRGGKGNFEEILRRFGEKSIDDIINQIKKSLSIINGLIIAFIVCFIAWGYMSFMSASTSATQMSGAF